VWRHSALGMPESAQAPAPGGEALQAVLHRAIIRLTKLLTRRGVEEEAGSTCLADNDNDGDSDEARTLRPLQPTPRQYGA